MVARGRGPEAPRDKRAMPPGTGEWAGQGSRAAAGEGARAELTDGSEASPRAAPDSNHWRRFWGSKIEGEGCLGWCKVEVSGCF